MTSQYFWKFLLQLLTFAFLLIKKTKGIFRMALSMLYNRQKRARLFRNLILSQDQIVNRLRELNKLPQEIIICLGTGQKLQNPDKAKIQNIQEWTERVNISKCNIYTLNKQSFLQSQSTKLTKYNQSFRSFYQKLLSEINESKVPSKCKECPLILVFNSIPYLSGLPYSKVKGGEIIFCGDLEMFSMVDYQQCLKRFAKTEQREGK